MVIFIRHAESSANAGGVTMINSAIPLSTHGLQQARELALEDIKTSFVQVSTFKRTHQTAEPFCSARRLIPHINPLLDEFSYIDPSLIVGMNLEQRRPISEQYWEASNPYAKNGLAAETFSEFQTRVQRFISGLNTLPAGTVIFGHGIWLALLIWNLQNQLVASSSDMKAFRHFQLDLEVPNASIWIIERNSRCIDRWSVMPRQI